ncbi:gamma-glutamyl-gamma-aminobutyrate hydrolase family protein [Paraburkholderia phenoliruptrix]|uniref:gamma-glutamyl-gamma-aminobutyrate hydrolase family protein n=1 Tax=Paraburkholderia phenoliruptrix TaxID=252970 RepID=UPI002869837C|nr:gamma-glutamyl-gamma-aminobutyrate hydrolase family protein [Paraburkholderia phenoliruptrix]WMY10890.1 gamma-glutamyl-gamma-aminobutyrate hydrolase family protein [Paraburkholderia phenoliruptrix]
MQPVIGITSNFDVEKDGYFCYAHYVRSIQKAGGLPVLLPYINETNVDAVLDLVSGLVLTGGGDFPTSMYGAEPHPAVARMIPERDQFEFALARAALDRDLPTFGICRGMQILNVIGGGTIYPHTLDEVSDAIDHRDGTPMDENVHQLHVERGTRLWELCGKPQDAFPVNSFHHQAIKALAPNFIVSARADDGVVEAIEATNRPFVVGVQWHPEWMYENEPACRNLFDNFVKVCAQS